MNDPSNPNVARLDDIEDEIDAVLHQADAFTEMLCKRIKTGIVTDRMTMLAQFQTKRSGSDRAVACDVDDDLSYIPLAGRRQDDPHSAFADRRCRALIS